MDIKLGLHSAHPTWVYTYPIANDEAMALARVIFGLGFSRIGIIVPADHFASQQRSLNLISESLGRGKLIEANAVVQCAVCDVSLGFADLGQASHDFTGFKNLGINVVVISGWPLQLNNAQKFLAADLRRQGFLSAGYAVIGAIGYASDLGWKE